MGNRKRMGMFDHAKYSKPVLRSMTEPVQKAVKRDINKLLDYGAASVRFRQPPEMPSDLISIVEDSFGQEEETMPQQSRKKFCPEIVTLDKPPIILASLFRPPPEKSLGLGRDPSFTAVRDALLRAVPAANKDKNSPKRMAAEERLALLLNPGTQQSQQYTPIQQHNDPSRQPMKASHFPDKCPLQQIAAQLMDSFPSITLRNNEPQTLTDATFSMAKRALVSAQGLYPMGADSMDAESSSVSAPTIDLNPLKSISDQTMRFVRASKSEEEYSDDNARELSMDESPTADICPILPQPYSVGDYFDGTSGADRSDDVSGDSYSYSTTNQHVYANSSQPPIFDFFRPGTSATQRTAAFTDSYDDFVPRVCDDGNPQPFLDFLSSASGAGPSGAAAASPNFDF